MPIFDEYDREREREERELQYPQPPEEEGFASTNPPDDGPVGGELPYDFGTFELPAYGGPWMPTMQFLPPPQFRGPQFQAPSEAEAMNEPGYQFRLNSGRNALERSAAARGVLRSGSTLTDLLEYGQNFGAQEYANVFNRALQGYDRNYRSAWDAFQPQLADWQFRSGFGRDAALAGFGRQYDIYALQAQAALERERMLMQSAMMPGPSAPVLG